MKRRSKAGGKAGKAGKAVRRKTVARRRAASTKSAPGRRAAGVETEPETSRVIRERDQAVEQLSAVSEVLQIISASQGELRPVFQAMLENATRICVARFGTLFQFDGKNFHTVAQFGTPPALAEFQRQRGPFQPAGQGFRRLVQSKEIIHTTDAAAEDALSPAVRYGGARSMIHVPMIKGDRLVGAISMYRQEVWPFTNKQIELVENFATQAVIAIENARLLNELRQRTDDLSEALEQQTATSDVLKVISTSPTDANPVFEAILESACQLCDSQLAAIFRFDGTLLHLAATKNWPADAMAALATRWPMPPDPHMTSGQVVLSKDVVIQEDALADANYDRDAAREGGWRRMLGVPMLRGNDVTGVIVVTWREPGPIVRKQVELFGDLCRPGGHRRRERAPVQRTAPAH